MAPHEARELRVNIMAMVSIGSKILAQMDNEEKPPTTKQSRQLKAEAEVREYMLTKRKIKQQKQSLTK